MLYKRLQLIASAEALYPPDYDFSIVFDTVENRKAAHTMSRKFDADAVVVVARDDLDGTQDLLNPNWQQEVADADFDLASAMSRGPTITTLDTDPSRKIA